MIKSIIEIVSLYFLPIFILLILIFALIKKVPIYETFIEGAKDGVKLGFDILPYLVAIIVAVSMFRASGAMDIISKFLMPLLDNFHIPVDVLPIMLTRSLSGSATLALLNDIVINTDVNSYATKLAAIMVGSSETTFYVLAVYFGAVGIKNYRHALLAGVLADVVGIILAILVCSYLYL